MFDDHSKQVVKFEFKLRGISQKLLQVDPLLVLGVPSTGHHRSR